MSVCCVLLGTSSHPYPQTHTFICSHTHFYSLFSPCSPPLPLCADRELFQTRPLQMLPSKHWHAQRHPSPPHSFFFFFSPHPSYIVRFTLSLCHSAALSLSSRWTWSQFSVCSALWCHSVNLLSASISWPELGWKVRKSTVKSTIHEKHKWEHWSLDSNNTGVYKGYHISATRGFMSLAQNSGPTSTAIQSSIFVALLHTSALYTQSLFFFTPVLRPRLCEPILHSWTWFKCLQRYCVVKVTFEQLFIWFYFYWARRGRLLP